MKREAGVYRVQVNESLPAHLFKSEIEKYRDVYFSMLASYKNSNVLKNVRVPISRDEDSVDIKFIRNYIAKKIKIKAENILFTWGVFEVLLLHNITLKDKKILKKGKK
tara:strand:+ start:237 stop:560 length:324 start_codon:yes stop_codon:yes gene_type:complete